MCVAAYTRRTTVASTHQSINQAYIYNNQQFYPFYFFPSDSNSIFVARIPMPAGAFIVKYFSHLSTTSGWASLIWSSLLCVFLSKFSCDFLWTKGDRMTVQREVCVGNGTVPEQGIPMWKAARRAKSAKKSSCWGR